MVSEAVGSIMTKKVECVTPSQQLVDVKHIFEKKDFHHHIPVTEHGRLVGMISLIDLMRKIGDAGLDDDEPVYQNLVVNDIMTPNPHFASPDEAIENIARVLAKGEYHAMPIVENEKVVGIVSTADVIRFFLEKDRGSQS